MTTGIQWTDETWNPTVGCSKTSEGCRNCYAIGQAYRNNAMGQKLANPGRLRYYDGLTEKKNGRAEWTGTVNFVPESLEIPIKWRKPRRIFVNSMSDLFHESVPFEQLDQIFAVMALTPHHTYQVLTKRPDRMLEYFQKRMKKPLPINAAIARSCYPSLSRFQDLSRSRLATTETIFPLPNVWLGVTVENQKAADDRISLLAQTPAALRFLSCEPLLEEVKIPHMESIDWAICGGESGHGARGCNIDHLNSIVEQCRYDRVPVLVKQLGAQPFSRDEAECSDYPAIDWPISDKKGAIVSEWPDYLQVQQFPD